MKRTYKIAMGIVAASGLALCAAVAQAHPGMGGGMGSWGACGGTGPSGTGPSGACDGTGPWGMGGGMGPWGMGHGRGAMGYGPMGGGFAAQQLMSPEERTALVDKMRNAKTPEERFKLAEENRAEMVKRAQEKGITLPEHRGPMGFGPGFK